MDSADAAEMVAEVHEAEEESGEASRTRFRNRAALMIAVLAAILAICGLGGGNATDDMIYNNIKASDTWAFFQAKNMRQTALLLAADEIEIGWLADPAMPEAAKQAMQKKLSDYKATIDRYESDPKTNEGKKELMVRAKEHEEARDHALKQDPYFDYAEALLQIAIVLISVSIIASLPWLAMFGGALGLIGALLTINGFFLFVEIPGLS